MQHDKAKSSARRLDRHITVWPPFAAIKPEDFSPAFAEAFAAHKAEIAAIADNPAPPTFENTMVALRALGRAARPDRGVFFNLAGADTNEAIEAIERDVAPASPRMMPRFISTTRFSRGSMGSGASAALGLDAEEQRVLERHQIAFRRAGAGQPSHGQGAPAAIGERLAALGTQFSQNVLADEKAFALILDEADLAGLPDWQRAAAAAAARSAATMANIAITLARSSVEPFLQTSQRRDMREKMLRAWLGRGENEGASDNRAIAAEMVKLRAGEGAASRL